jgi:hypothetical protein
MSPFRSRRQYIVAGINDYKDIVQNGDGYYHDLLSFGASNLHVSRVGTVNYNRLVSDIAGAVLPKDVEYLNGSVSDYYDPFLNAIVSLPDPDDYTTYPHVLVPFLFTQSGIKPLTSVTMSRRYVELYDDLRGSDAVVTVGFGFQRDDGHINGLFRQLIEDDQKQTFICHYTRGTFDAQQTRRFYRKKLRIEGDPANLHIIQVDASRRTSSGKRWFEEIADQL